ncbi:uncharacterized protein LOC135947433 [Cloeon dipterum]|uniref:uncharacterized protein LOC135947433 n=1 Tax=Cloeon dipterum TaxID=197152 RepID=UPI00321FD74B
MAQSTACVQMVCLAAVLFMLAASRTMNIFGCWAEMDRRQWTPSQCGLVFGVEELIGALVVLFFSPRTVQLIGSKLMIHYGIFSIGITFLIYSLADYYLEDPAFYVFALACRAVAGVATAITYLASFVFLLTSEPTKATYCVLILAYGAGLICGSFLGSLNGIKDNEFNFIVLLFALTVMCASFVIPANLPEERNIDFQINTDDATKIIPEVYIQRMNSLAAWISSAQILAASWCFNFITATIGPFLQNEVQFSKFEIGFALSALFLTASVTAIVVGLLSHRGAPLPILKITGLVSLLLGLILIGPIEFASVPLTGPVCLMGIIAIGVGFSSVFVSVSSALTLIVQAEVEPRNTLVWIVGCVLSVAYVVGSIFGSDVSGVVLEQVGFQNCIYLLMAPVLFALTLEVIQVMFSRDRQFSEESLTGSMYGTIALGR